MANELDEMTAPVNEAGRDVHVIEKQIQVKVGPGSTVFQVLLWLTILGGIIFTYRKAKARSYLQQLQQKVQHDASTIDNYQLQRVAVLQNCAKLLDKAVALDKDTFTEIAKLRSGNVSDEARNEIAGKIDNVGKAINVAFENYPDLKAHKEIADAMQQNKYLMQEITAARDNYNDTVNLWNSEIFAWPCKMIVAAKAGYTTRIPFIASAEIKQQADYGVFF
ncbi:MAG: LemA family protein [Bacilli bacterium]|nr:LemA family protein [Bacilli bacterium]MDY6430284.1 LemA family protein [Bacilli bacterium]